MKDKERDGNGLPAAGYEVGYCKPPKSTQFKPGQSGNPGGRPKKRHLTSLDAAVAERLAKVVTIDINGKPQTMTMAQAIAIQMTTKAAQGDDRAFATLLKLAPKTSFEEALQEQVAGASQSLAEKLNRIIANRERNSALDGNKARGNPESGDHNK